MKFVLLFVVVVVAFSAFTDKDLRRLEESMHPDIVTSFKQFKADHGKQYETVSEEMERITLYEDRYRFIQQHNEKYDSGEKSFFLKVNHFADMTNEEIQQGLIHENNLNLGASRFSGGEFWNVTEVQSKLGAPKTCVDWQTNYQTNIKNQLQCGSCYAFGCTASMEAAYKMKYGGNVPSYSEMELTACHTWGGGCSGGWPSDMFDYAKSNGISYESDYPYCDPCSDRNCKYYLSDCMSQDVICDDNRITPRAYVLKWWYTGYDSEIALIYGVGSQVVTAALNCGDEFMFYGGGIFTGSTSYKYTGIHAAHAVSITGLGQGFQSGNIRDCVTGGTKFFVLRNSWGRDAWGEAGYMRVKRTDRTTTYADADKIGRWGIWFPEMTKA